MSKTSSCLLFPCIPRRKETGQTSTMEPFCKNSFKNTILTCIFSAANLTADNIVRGSRPVVFCEKYVFTNGLKFIRKHLRQKTQVFSCKFANCKIFKNTFFIEHLRQLLLHCVSLVSISHTFLKLILF